MATEGTENTEEKMHNKHSEIMNKYSIRTSEKHLDLLCVLCG